MTQPNDWPPPAGVSAYPYQSPVRPAVAQGAVTIALLALSGATAFAGIVVAARHVLLLDEAIADPRGADLSRLDFSDTLIAWIGVVQFLLFVATGVMFCVWLWRARDNADAIVDHGQRWGRPWVIAGWIVPILNLWIPKQVVDDVWTASAGRTDGRKSRLLLAWWICWLAFLIGDRITRRVLGDDGDLAGERRTVLIGILLTTPGIAAAVLAALAIWKINQMQQSQADRIAATIAPQPQQTPPPE